VFTGATIGVAKNNHIQVDFFYTLHAARLLSQVHEHRWWT
jgi:TRAP-type C4-dicarboxylate transport system permease small subunit